MNTQVKKEYYNFTKYVTKERWNSYYYQIMECCNVQGEKVLLIGVGDNIVTQVLSKTGKKVTTLDFDKSLNPDVCASVTDLDTLITQKYDIIMCCQVLEHLKFDEFENIIKKMSKIATERVILSLPTRNMSLIFAAKHTMTRIFKIRIPIYRFWDKKFVFNGEHYWEVNAKRYPRFKIDKIIKKYFVIEKMYYPIENTYHLFYTLIPLKSKTDVETSN